MSCSITYPLNNGPGACSGTNLITACGNWNYPIGAVAGDTIRVFGKLYNSTPTGADLKKPPSDATPGTAIDSGGTRTWHFNGNPIPGAAIGSPRTLMIWITADTVSCYDPGSPVTFNCCDSSASGCSAAPCAPSFAYCGPSTGGMSYSAADSPPCADLTVLKSRAPLVYRLELEASLLALAEAVFHLPDGFRLPPVSLSYHLRRSAPERAVWMAKDLADRYDLTLAVTRSSCGGLCAELVLQHVGPQGVLPPLRWQSISFDLQQGGLLLGVSSDGSKLGSALRVTVPESEETEPAPEEAEPLVAAH